MFKKISLFLIAIISVIALVGCFNLDEVDSIEFVNFPQATYYKVEAADVAKLNQAYDTLLGEITIKINNQDPITLKQAITNGTVTVNFDASILTTTGTKTMVITLGSAKLTYVFNVVEAQLFARGNGTAASPYEIETPEQFLNIGTRVFGVPVPTTSSTEDAWMYYYQFSFPYLAGGKHYKLANDLDFTGVDYRTLGSLGGMNYIPFTGVLDGNNKKIMNLTVNTFSDSSSLFAALSGATVKDLTFTNIKIESFGKYGAALFSQVGRPEGDLYYNYVENVNVESGSIIAERVGGLAGEAINTFFKNCTIGSVTNPDALVLRAYLDSNSGGIVGAALERKYSYKTLNYNGIVKPTYTFDYAKIKQLSGVEIEDNAPLNGICGNYKKDYTRAQMDGKTSINYESPTKYNIVIYNCSVYAKVYVAHDGRGGVYTDASSVSEFIFNSSNSNEMDDIMYNSDENVMISTLLADPMDSGEYATVEYSLSGKFDNGTYSWQVLFIDQNVFSMTTFNLDELGFKNYVYNIDGEVTETLNPAFTTGGYTLAAFYYDSNGNLLGVYKESLSGSLDATKRILTRSLD